MEKQGFPLESFHRDAVMQKFVNWANTQHFSLTEQCHHLRWYWLSPRMFFGFLFLSFSWVATRPSGMSLGGHQPRPALHVCDWLQKCAVLKISYLQKIKAIKFNMVKSLLNPNSVVGDGGPILMGKKKKRQNFLGIVWGHREVLKILLTAFRVTRIWLCAICCSCAFFCSVPIRSGRQKQFVVGKGIQRCSVVANPIQDKCGGEFSWEDCDKCQFYSL